MESKADSWIGDIFAYFSMTLSFGSSFILAYYAYVNLIHKKEQRNLVTSFSKWSIIASLTLVIALPLVFIADLYINTYLLTNRFNFRLFLQFLFLLIVIMIFNNLLVQFIQQAQVLKKLSKKTKTVSKPISKYSLQIFSFRFLLLWSI